MYEEIRKNKQKSITVVALFALVIILVASVAGYAYVGDPLIGGIIGGIIGLLYTFFSVTLASKSVLRLANAKQITESNTDNVKETQVVNITKQLAMMANIPEPDVYIIEDNLPNAFATGFKPENAAVGVTTGLVERLNRAEIEAVIAHEIAHIQNYDTRLKTIIFSMGGLLVLMGRLMMRTRTRSSSSNNKNNGSAALLAMLVGIVVYLFGEIFSKLVQLWVSRKREYLADATAVELTRNPQALISALAKISNMEPSEVADSSMASMYFMNPLKNNDDKDSMWSTHPTTKNRIKELQKL